MHHCVCSVTMLLFFQCIVQRNDVHFLHPWLSATELNWVGHWPSVNVTSVSEGALVVFIMRRVKSKCDRCLQTFRKNHQNIQNNRKYKSSFLLNADISRLNLAASGLIINYLLYRHHVSYEANQETFISTDKHGAVKKACCSVDQYHCSS